MTNEKSDKRIKESINDQVMKRHEQFVVIPSRIEILGVDLQPFLRRYYDVLD